MSKHIVPEALSRELGSFADGAARLERLPSLIDDAAQRWGLRLEAPFPAGSAGWTAPARTRDGEDAVVKIVFPHEEAAAEPAGLRLWSGQRGPEIRALPVGRCGRACVSARSVDSGTRSKGDAGPLYCRRRNETLPAPGFRGMTERTNQQDQTQQGLLRRVLSKLAPGHLQKGTMHAAWRGVVIAASDDTIVVEGNHYFPAESVRMESLQSSSDHTVCPWKGTASYYHVIVDGDINRNAAWYYPDPSPAARHIAGRIAFWGGVEVHRVE